MLKEPLQFRWWSAYLNFRRARAKHQASGRGYYGRLPSDFGWNATRLPASTADRGARVVLIACDSGLRALADFLNSSEFAADDADRGVARERQALNVRTPYAAGGSSRGA